MTVKKLKPLSKREGAPERAAFKAREEMRGAMAGNRGKVIVHETG